MNLDHLQHGDPVVWLHRPRGGYCQPVRVLATYLGRTNKRVRIEVYREWPEPHPNWAIRKTVSPQWVVSATDEEHVRVRELATGARIYPRVLT